MNFFILAAFGTMIAWAVGDFLAQRMAKAVGSLHSLAWINLITGVFLLPFAISDLPKITSWPVLWPLLATGVVDFAFGLTLLTAYEKGKLSVIEVVMITELPLTIILGMAIFSERPSLIQYSLIAAILGGVFLISQRPQNIWTRLWSCLTRKNCSLEKGLALTLVAAILSSIYNFMIAFNARAASPLLAIWIPWVVCLIGLAIYLSFRGGFRQIAVEARLHGNLILAGTAMQAAGWLLFAMVLAQKELSITTAITESYPALAMFLGVKFNKEKISPKQYLGAIIALFASLIIAFT